MQSIPSFFFRGKLVLGNSSKISDKDGSVYVVDFGIAYLSETQALISDFFKNFLGFPDYSTAKMDLKRIKCEMESLFLDFMVVEEAVIEGESLQFENSPVNVDHHVMMSPADVFLEKWTCGSRSFQPSPTSACYHIERPA